MNESTEWTLEVQLPPFADFFSSDVFFFFFFVGFFFGNSSHNQRVQNLIFHINFLLVNQSTKPKNVAILGILNLLVLVFLVR